MRGASNWLSFSRKSQRRDRPGFRARRTKRRLECLAPEILEPRVVPSTVQVVYTLASNWGSGFQGQIAINSTDPVAIPNWKLQFTLNATISSIWDATIVSHTGTQYTVEGDSWDSSIPANGSQSFGFVANPGGVAAPSGYILNGIPIANWGSQNPVAGNVNASTYENQAATINVLASDSDPNGYALSLSSFTQGKDGGVAKGASGTLVYTPKTGFLGADSFTYTITNGHGGKATGRVTVNVQSAGQSVWPSQYFAPYVDMTLYPTYNLTSAMQNAGLKYFTLAFVVADTANGNQPSWGGYSSYDVNGGAYDMALRSQVMAVRAKGGDAMVSFGGASGTELAQAITNVSSLTSAYQTVINAYNLTQIDFDIEGAAEADHASIDRRSQAMAALEQTAAAQGRPLSIWLTLPVLPSGLTSDGVYVLDSAIKYGVKIAGVNIMTMDYGSSEAPNPNDMGTYAIDAAQSLHSQLATAYGSSLSSAQLWRMVGVTPMIGLNDVSPELFSFAAAQQLTTFAEQVGIGRISMWSLNRDQQDPKGAINYVEDDSSSLAQSLYEFSEIFLKYEKG